MTAGGYDAFDDPYAYPGTAVLRNLLDIRDPDVLQAFEVEISTLRAEEPLPKGVSILPTIAASITTSFRMSMSGRGSTGACALRKVGMRSATRNTLRRRWMPSSGRFEEAKYSWERAAANSSQRLLDSWAN